MLKRLLFNRMMIRSSDEIMVQLSSGDSQRIARSSACANDRSFESDGMCERNVYSTVMTFSESRITISSKCALPFVFGI
jgi:hypothetical protein